MQSKADRLEEYLVGMPYGMTGWCVPPRIFPAGSPCDPRQPLPFAVRAPHKNHLVFYMGCLHGDSPEVERFGQPWAATGKKREMGRSCIQFKKLEDLPLEGISEAFPRIFQARFVPACEQTGMEAAARKSGKK